MVGMALCLNEINLFGQSQTSREWLPRCSAYTDALGHSGRFTLRERRISKK